MFHVWTVILVYVCSRWPLEMHLVHYDRQFKFSEAAKRKRGLAVLAVFFHVSIECNVYSRMHLKDNLILEYTCHLHTNITYIHTSPTYSYHLHTHDFRIPPQSRWELCSSGILCNQWWYLNKLPTLTVYNQKGTVLITYTSYRWVSATPNMLSHFPCNYRSPINSCRTQSELH